jgi:hypothetical protein
MAGSPQGRRQVGTVDGGYHTHVRARQLLAARTRAPRSGKTTARRGGVREQCGPPWKLRAIFWGSGSLEKSSSRSPIGFIDDAGLQTLPSGAAPLKGSPDFSRNKGGERRPTGVALRDARHLPR